MSNQSLYHDNINIDEFVSLCSQTVSLDDFLLAATSENNVLIYDGEQLNRQLTNNEKSLAIRSE